MGCDDRSFSETILRPPERRLKPLIILYRARRVIRRISLESIAFFCNLENILNITKKTMVPELIRRSIW